MCIVVPKLYYRIVWDPDLRIPNEPIVYFIEFTVTEEFIFSARSCIYKVRIGVCANCWSGTIFLLLLHGEWYMFPQGNSPLTIDPLCSINLYPPKTQLSWYLLLWAVSLAAHIWWAIGKFYQFQAVCTHIKSVKIELSELQNPQSILKIWYGISGNQKVGWESYS